MKYFSLLFIGVVIFSCKSKPEKKEVESIDPKLLISCDGIGEVKMTDSYVDLQQRFGDSVLSEHENSEAGKFTSVWENNPKQINIYWKEEKPPFKSIDYMEAVDRLGPYMTSDSIHVGMSIRDLVRKNNSMALTLRNFEVSNPGLIIGFNNGDIPKHNPCLTGRLERVGQDPIDVHELREFQAQEVVKSFDRILQRMHVELSTIRITRKK